MLTLSLIHIYSMARLTVYQYLTPNGEVIPANGLYPNEVVKNRLEFVNECEHFEPVTFAVSYTHLDVYKRQE